MVRKWSSGGPARLCRWLVVIALGFALSPSNASAPPLQPAPDSFLGNLADLPLTDQTGHTFQPAALTNHVVLFSFIYTRCGSICPAQTRTLARVLRQLPGDVRRHVRFVSVSIDPEADSPQQLQAFARRMNADLDGWFFLTGAADRIEQLTQRLLLFGDRAERPAMHKTTLWLIDTRGRLVQRYLGDPPDERRLVNELSQLSRMNSQSRPL